MKLRHIEPLLDKSNDRVALLPIKCPDMWLSYKKEEAAVWHASEIGLEQDKKDWPYLKPEEQFYIKNVLGFFASSDLIVSDNLAKRFMTEVVPLEAKFFYGFQLMMENIHSEVYSNLIDGLIDDKKEKESLFRAVETMECVKRKADWAKKWITSNESFAARLVAFAIVEGIFFSGSFCAIYWLAERNILPGLCKANEFIARDEGMHTDFACLLYNKYIINKLSDKEFVSILTEAVDLELYFNIEALPVNLIGINSDNMVSYIKFCANRLAKQLGHDIIYDEKIAYNPFMFMEKIALREKSNFFEEEVGAYSKFDHNKTNNEVELDNTYDDL